MTIVLTRLGNAETLSHLRTERHCVGKAPRAQNFSAQCLNMGLGKVGGMKDRFQASSWDRWIMCREKVR